MNTPDPRGMTLWEMFLEWIRKLFRGPRQEAPASTGLPNPFEWEPGVPVALDVSHGPEFADALVRVENVRHSVRVIAGRHFDFIDYVLKVTPRQGDPGRVRIRCVPGSGDQWSSVLLRLHDEFAYAREFVELLEDPTGVFKIEDDPSGAPVEFTRLHGLTGPWQVSARDYTGKPAADTNEPAYANYKYWDYQRMAGSDEEFLFVEIDDQTGWTQLWRGGVFRL